MANYKVIKPFPCSRRLLRGEILIDPAFRNLGYLVNQGYLKKVADETSVPEIEMPQSQNPVEIESAVSKAESAGGASPAQFTELPAAKPKTAKKPAKSGKNPK